MMREALIYFDSEKWGEKYRGYVLQRKPNERLKDNLNSNKIATSLS